MGTKVRRPLAVAAIELAAALLLGSGVALAADPPADVVLDATVTIRHVDAFDGPIAGATITVVSYRDPAAPIQSLTATTDGLGVATLTAVARPVDGAAAVLLDVRSDLVTSIVDEAGCTETESWSAGRTSIPSAPGVEVLLDSTAKSLEVSCPQPTDPPAGTEPSARPSGDPGNEPSDGGVLAATGRPQVTPPATDSAPAAGRLAQAPAAGGVLAAVLASAVGLLAAGRLARGPERRRR